MQKSLPILLRELLFACGTLVLVAGSMWLFAHTIAPTPIPLASSTTFTNKGIAPVTEAQAVDTDKDGLPDFEERLWGTDQETADTDGDGTNDGKEVTLGRNPKKAGPNDTLATPLKVVEQTYIPEKPIPTYTAPPSEMSTTPPSSITTKTPQESPLHLYGNVVGALIMEAGTDSTAELALLNRLAGNKKMNGELTKELLTMAQKYDALAKDIASVEPPEKAVAVHNKLADTYRNYAKAVHLFANTPLGSYVSGTTTIAYSESTLALGHAVVDVSDLFYREHITFGKNEPGNVFSFPR